MPYKTGALKGKLNATEIRKLIKAHNILVTMKIPKGAKREDIIALVEKNGYKVNHEKQALVPRVEMQRKKTIGLKKAEELTKPKPLTEEQKKQRQQAKQKKEGQKAFLKTVIPKPPPASKPSKGVKVGKPPPKPKKEEPKEDEKKDDKMKGFKILSDFLNNNLKKRIKIINDYLDGKITEDKREELENDMTDILDTDMRKKVDPRFLEPNFTVKSKYLKSLQDQTLVKELKSILNKKPKQKKEEPKEKAPKKEEPKEKAPKKEEPNKLKSLISKIKKNTSRLYDTNFLKEKNITEWFNEWKRERSALIKELKEYQKNNDLKKEDLKEIEPINIKRSKKYKIREGQIFRAIKEQDK